MILDFSEIPSSTKLFLDYLNNFSAVQDYFNYSFRDENKYLEVFENIRKNDTELKNELSDIILNQYSSFSPSEKTLKNINLLKEENTIVIFTGQQLGLLGGPLYTFYKIFTSIKLSEYLIEKFSEYNFVPVFWMAGDDHDFEEISLINFIDAKNQLKTVTYYDGNEKFFNRGSVGDLKFKDSINSLRNEIVSRIRETEFSKELFKLLDILLKENISIAESFKKLILSIFDDTGLIIFNPQDSKVKKLLRPIFKKELLDYKKHNKDILITSADLEENYHAQVKVKPINLFLSDETGRHLIEPVENEYRLKGKRKRITEDQILDMLGNYPERFSPNVLLRPICEDYLFQTGFYVAGPGEISYYAQTIPLYKHFNLQQPIIYPRASATIVESNIAKTLVKYNLSTHDFISEKNNVKELVMNNLSANNLDNLFNETNTLFKEKLEELANKLSEIDPALENLTKSSEQKILHQIEVLKNKSHKFQENKYDAVIRQISKAENHLFPNNNLQERELSFINFVNKYGFDFFDWLYNELDIHEFKHQILEI